MKIVIALLVVAVAMWGYNFTTIRSDVEAQQVPVTPTTLELRQTPNSEGTNYNPQQTVDGKELQ